MLHQGRIEQFFLDNIKKYSDDTIHVERATLPESLQIDESRVEDDSAYPVTFKLRRLTDEEATPQQQSIDSKAVDGLFRSNLISGDEDADLLRKSQARGSVSETVHAKYVIGCDGAHSWTRQQLGFELKGEATDFIWGVMDIIPITDFREPFHFVFIQGPLADEGQRIFACAVQSTRHRVVVSW